MAEMTECPICGERLQAEQVNVGREWAGLQIQHAGRLRCPNGHDDTVEFTKGRERWEAEQQDQ